MKRLTILAALYLLAPCYAFCAGEPALPAGHGGGSAGPAIRSTVDTGQLQEPHKGKVVQIINSGGYTYVQLKKKSGEKIWLAVPDAPIEVGSQMTFNPGMLMVNFQSKTLNRTFDKIVFTDLPTPPKGAKKASDVKGKSPGSGGTVSPDMKVKVKKATGTNAYTISELYKNKAKLDKKQVRVRGKVVKVSANIMGKTWIHLRDGSGSHATGDFNLVVTSQSVPAEGETVTVNGTLYKNKDFGGGYKYDIIVEKAEITVE
ncbi:DNA-binding protein [Geobacter argillaceus]|uniref:DNA-binding protein n=1 Tax=Geobacter argillaceus TaxID=345631 RepID=A0A562WUM2_9BACT|nr:DNA-binding protein [Geobacter argillaceus]TWJ33359.1 hypothetical protein JN12_00031 [Geobacter argillaceus]